MVGGRVLDHGVGLGQAAFRISTEAVYNDGQAWIGYPVHDAIPFAPSMPFRSSPRRSCGVD